jgi:hydroxymethylglutaryl-CoA lyase
MPVSASEPHSLANIGMTHDQVLAEVARVIEYRDALPADARPAIEVGVSTAFGCTIAGPVSEDWVIELSARLARLGVDSVGLSTASATPIRRR